MGFWKRQKDMFQGVTSPEFAELYARSKRMETPSMLDTIRQANAALDMYGDQARLMQTGIPGRAAIEAATDTGLTVNEQAIAELTLTVQVDGRAPYRATTRQPVPRLMPGAFAPGATIPVRVDPADPGVLIYDHAAHALGT
jgi:hypothetical protein